jgi:hypothetical protein
LRAENKLCRHSFAKALATASLIASPLKPLAITLPSGPIRKVSGTEDTPYSSAGGAFSPGTSASDAGAGAAASDCGQRYLRCSSVR